MQHEFFVSPDAIQLVRSGSVDPLSPSSRRAPTSGLKHEGDVQLTTNPGVLGNSATIFSRLCFNLNSKFLQGLRIVHVQAEI